MRDIHVHEDKKIAAGQFIEEKKYWTNKFKGDLTLSHFPYDYPGNYAAENTLNTTAIKFDKDIIESLEKLRKGSYPKLHMLLMTGLTALIYKYTGNKDIIIGTTIDKQETEGEFTNTVLALRNQLPDTMTFKELLLQVKQTIIEALEHQNYPFETLLSQLSTNYTRDDFQLFDIVLLLENLHSKEYLRGIKPNIAFYFQSQAENLEGVLEYNSCLYEKVTIERIIKHFMHLLRAALLNLDLQLQNISLLTGEEERQLILDFNNTDSEYPGDKPIHVLFEEQVRRTPDHIALVGMGHGLDDRPAITYHELNKQSNRLAHQIREKSGGPDTIVGIMVNPSIEMIIGILGILKAGSAYLPIEPIYPKERIRYILSDSNCSILVSGNKFMDAANELSKTQIINLQSINNYQSPIFNSPSNQYPIIDTQSLAYVIYTSGTTGRPKGVMIEHQGLVNYIWWAAKTYVREERVNFPLYTSISFDLTITSIFTPLITGQTIFIYESNNKKLLIEQVMEHNNIGILKLTPSHLKLIKNKKVPPPFPCGGDHLPGGIKRFIVGGENLETQLAKDVCMNFKDIEIYNEYGPTENVVGSMIYKFNPQRDKRESVSIGVPIDNTKIYLVDRNQRLVPAGIAGEVLISGDGTARGYMNNPGLTAEKFIKNPFVQGQRMYRTGDLAVRLPDGTLEFAGRIDNQVKIRGFRMELGEIEKQLLTHEEIRETVVLSIVKSLASEPVENRPGSNSDEIEDQKRLSAYIVTDREITPHELRKYLSNRLPDYMIPSYFVKVEKIPLTPNGKVDRRALQSIEIEPDTGVEFAAPRNEIEQKIADTWMEVLKLDKVSIHENFFDLGGSSIDVIRMNEKLKMVVNLNGEDDFVSKMFRYTTISSLARYLSQKDSERVSRQNKTVERSTEVDKIKRKMANQRNKRRGQKNVRIR
jgi:amino acid adenylation domain-containing protein